MVRFVGCLAGAWLLISFLVSGWRTHGAFTDWSLLADYAYSASYQWPTLVLALLFLLPWSRLRSTAVWLPMFALLITCGAGFLEHVILPYTAVWRPRVLFDTGILQSMIFYSLLVIAQIATIAAMRFRRWPAT